jgi:hypothetical protein
MVGAIHQKKPGMLPGGQALRCIAAAAHEGPAQGG